MYLNGETLYENDVTMDSRYHSLLFTHHNFLRSDSTASGVSLRPRESHFQFLLDRNFFSVNGDSYKEVSLSAALNVVYKSTDPQSHITTQQLFSFPLASFPMLVASSPQPQHQPVQVNHVLQLNNVNGTTNVVSGSIMGQSPFAGWLFLCWVLLAFLL